MLNIGDVYMVSQFVLMPFRCHTQQAEAKWCSQTIRNWQCSKHSLCIVRVLTTGIICYCNSSTEQDWANVDSKLWGITLSKLEEFMQLNLSKWRKKKLDHTKSLFTAFELMSASVGYGKRIHSLLIKSLFKPLHSNAYFLFCSEFAEVRFSPITLKISASYSENLLIHYAC